jgi:hypothetical protein
MYLREYRRARSEEFVSFLKEVKRRHPNRGLYLILDNVGIHRSRYTMGALRKEPEMRRVRLIYLPVNAGNLNRMEDRWSDLQVEAIDNNSFSSRQELVDAIQKYVRYYNGDRKEVMGRR